MRVARSVVERRLGAQAPEWRRVYSQPMIVSARASGRSGPHRALAGAATRTVDLPGQQAPALPQFGAAPAAFTEAAGGQERTIGGHVA